MSDGAGEAIASGIGCLGMLAIVAGVALGGYLLFSDNAVYIGQTPISGNTVNCRYAYPFGTLERRWQVSESTACPRIVKIY